VGFQARLGQLVQQVEGAVACALLGADGIPLGQQGAELEAAWVEWGPVLQKARTAADALGSGALEELSVQAGGMWVLMRPVGAGHHLALVVRAGGNPGKGRFLLRLHAPEVAAELAQLS